ncbi:spore coat protein CotJB [Pseudalkalibacillus salsuginis]|uniref:spore coat protein CotJB n=1 Tax=Pseudalkalibacillus salsuginis TaxID=2910972 RepID=UPI001CD7E14E|nr:spore coat protein CotJB [Pseudalkalibacillus salsuginis]MCF6409287.1 spore coat protein CotJB [Pseudalkalibacillus salsuginis]
MPDEFYQWMKQLQEIDFVLVELTLYLDTHPEDYDSIKQFNEFAEKGMRLRQKIEKKYGPLMQYGQSYSGYPWNWDDPPWPWQM